MSPLAPADRWWSEDLGAPSSSGAQDGKRYAFFADKKLLLVETDGTLQRFRTAEHRITGISQSSGGGTPAFTTERGPISIDKLERVA